MGKGFNNYMCKKFFHPASRDNLKRVWMAEQKNEAYKKKQEELKTQYEKEQDLYTNKAMLSKDSKDKLSVNFLYEPPPGAKKEREREDNEPEYKFEWQRKYNAPRESYCKGDSEIRDQPFGIQVRNVRCIKCHKWGHINTDRECPMFKEGMNHSLGLDPLNKSSDEKLNPMELVKQMKEDGLQLKTSALALQHHVDMRGNRTMIPEPSMNEELLKTLTTDQKIKFLKTLKKMLKEKKNKKKKEKERKERKDKKKRKRSHKDSDEDEIPEKKKKRKKKNHRDSEEDEMSEEKRKNHRNSKGEISERKKRSHEDSEGEISEKRRKSRRDSDDDRRSEKKKRK